VGSNPTSTATSSRGNFMRLRWTWLAGIIALVLAGSLAGDITLVANRSGSDSAKSKQSHATPSPTPTTPAETPRHLAIRISKITWPTKELRGWKVTGKPHALDELAANEVGEACGYFPPGAAEAVAVGSSVYTHDLQFLEARVVAFPSSDDPKQDFAYAQRAESRACRADKAKGLAAQLTERGSKVTASPPQRVHAAPWGSANLWLRTRLNVSGSFGSFRIYQDDMACGVGRVEVQLMVVDRAPATTAFVNKLMNAMCTRVRRALS
jgi:hypothetical protein